MKDERKKLIDIDHEKICDCSDNTLNCLDGKEWVRSQIGVWEFEYEKRDLEAKEQHPAVFPIGLPKKVIRLFTHEGELVIDPFVGVGTTLLAAKDTNRNAVGFDLKKDYIEYAEKRLNQKSFHDFNYSTKQVAICDDALNIPDYIPEKSVKLTVTSPPYADMLDRKMKNKSRRGDKRINENYLENLQYSEDEDDLGTMEVESYIEKLKNIYENLLPLMKDNSHTVVNVNDLWTDENRRILIPFKIVNALKDIGYVFKNLIIWDRRNIINNIGIFGYPSNYITLGTTFEYILHFEVRK